MAESFDPNAQQNVPMPPSQYGHYNPDGSYVPGTTELEGKFGNASLRLKTYRFVDMLVGVIVFASAATLYISYEHKLDMRVAMSEMKLAEKESAKLLSDVLKEQTKATQEQTRAIFFQACLLSVAPEKRNDAYINEFSQCRQIRNF